MNFKVFRDPVFVNYSQDQAFRWAICYSILLRRPRGAGAKKTGFLTGINISADTELRMSISLQTPRSPIEEPHFTSCRNGSPECIEHHTGANYSSENTPLQREIPGLKCTRGRSPFFQCENKISLESILYGIWPGNTLNQHTISSHLVSSDVNVSFFCERIVSFFRFRSK
jgi:hypothetical protein